MHAARGHNAARQRHVDGFGRQLLFEFGVGERLAAGRKRSIDGLLDRINRLAALLALFGRERAEPLHEHRHSAGLTEVTGLCVFKGRRLRCGRKIGLGRFDQLCQFIHRSTIKSAVERGVTDNAQKAHFAFTVSGSP